MNLRHGAAVLLLCVASSSAWAAPPTFLPEEQAWLSSAPVVRYAIDPGSPPLEYLEDGKPQGLAIEFLKEIEASSGVRFEFVLTESWQESIDLFRTGAVQLLPGITANQTLAEQLGPKLTLYPYYTGLTAAVTRADGAVVIDPHSLEGRRVAVLRSGNSARWVAETVSSATVLPYDSTQAMLEAVVAGDADVAVAPEIVLLPQLQRAFQGQLNWAGTLPQLPVRLSMLISPNQPMLLDVLDRTIRSLSAHQSDQAFERWIDDADFGRPSVSALIRYYWVQISLAALVLVSLAAVSIMAVRSRAQAQRAKAEKSRFLAIMSHEIRTAMNAVVGPIDLLWRQPDSPERHRLIHTARSGSQLLLHTVNSLLDLSQLQAGKLSIQPRAVTMFEIVDEVMDLVRAPAEEKGLRVVSHVSTDLVVSIDPLRYRQVLLNVLSNAVKFTMQGTVSIDVSRLVGTAGPILRTVVKDSGVGISPQELTTLFSDYAQASAGRNAPQRGTGLGLVICKEILQAAGGTIQASSRPGVGTTLTFEWPVPEGTAAERPERAPRKDGHARFSAAVALPGPATAGQTILVVDDNEVNRRIVADQLALLGYHVRLCANAMSALAAWRAQDYFAILMDCQMPGVDGYQLCRMIRAEEAERELEPTLILALSARAEPAHRVACFEAGMNGILTKPIDTEALANTLNMWSGGAQSAAPRPAMASDAANRRELDALFLQTSREDIAEMRKAIEQRLETKFAAHAHRIKGAALALDNKPVARLAGYIETARAQSEDDWKALSHELGCLEGLIEDAALD